MASILIAFESDTGQTSRVAEQIDAALTERGHEVTTNRVGEISDAAVTTFDAVLVGSPVVNRAHLPAVVAFVERHRETLSSRPSAFFQVSMASAVPFAAARSAAVGWVDDLVDRTGWEPDRVAFVAGSIAYTQYDPITRAVFKLVAALTTGDTDASRDYEYTDWDEVEAFAVEFAALAERREAKVAPTRTDRRRARVAAGVGVLIGLATLVYWLLGRRSDGGGDGGGGGRGPGSDPGPNSGVGTRERIAPTRAE
ncbi:flavodoxin domain-containing protein [Natronolimnohabitans innermongolicus]|uniref:Protoporphyrinogen oxidase n=1 Tax=Natronolimnohabitans innermongolicus JCM 12255 TaxID=1227499 RepID=L9WXT6_9EURY|nr:flavodoxin domain-containing protein [Natronolimnohabitans innermongolicus]ELY54284.1 protoporphyrinogen oxidase [Natronolimnohabitans innermongolicus JCM 12255]